MWLVLVRAYPREEKRSTAASRIASTVSRARSWAGPLLCFPLRRLFERPETLLGDHVRPGITVLEPGCGMGYFTLPIARRTGPAGRVAAVDLQPKMIEGLTRRARRAGLLERIEAVACADGDLGFEALPGVVDVAVVIHVLHEVRDCEHFLEQVYAALRPGGRLLLLEPRGHVSRGALDAELATQAASGPDLEAIRADLRR